MSVVGFDEDQSGLQVIMAEGLRPFSGYLVVPLMQAMSRKCLTWARDLEPCCRTYNRGSRAVSYSISVHNEFVTLLSRRECTRDPLQVKPADVREYRRIEHFECRR